jgi:anti-anti-sigma factor
MGLECTGALCIGSRAIVSYHEQQAVLRCCGDEDIATQGCRRAAMSRALGAGRDVVVDLRELTFADSSLMLDLAMVARRLRFAGRRLHVRDAQPQVWRVIEMVGLHRLPGVVAERGAAII